MSDPRLDDYVRVGEAAELLGVSSGTVRNWARSGKLREHRHPLNDYRLFDRRDLEALLRRTRESGRSPRQRAKTGSRKRQEPA